MGIKSSLPLFSLGSFTIALNILINIGIQAAVGGGCSPWQY